MTPSKPPAPKKPVKYPPHEAGRQLTVAQNVAPYGAGFTASAIDMVGAMRAGMPAQIVADTASRLGISQDRLYESLRLPRSTLKSRVSKGQPLAAVEQDRMYRVHRVLERAQAVLEDEAAAIAWINRENRALGGEAPLALLDTEAGYELVQDTLCRIEYGVLS
ncbi:antitoxin Xre/MbcA/ParS toxin-binding domain-containing protein [Noviherbaspirillum sp. 1P10PC]|uniref:type II RES/Xre toxin-antitoxin system antitoxin n=1 Tax=Noviherbaspirillum sp. 1P10PC TaxID=3132292 RepID=UPI0039A22EE6